MVSKTYSYQTGSPEAFFPEERKLLLQWTPEFLLAGLQNINNNELVAVEIFQGLVSDVSHIAAASNQSILLNIKEIPVVFFNAGKQFLPVPGSEYEPESAMAQLSQLAMLGNQDRQFTDKAYAKEIIIQWAMPGYVADAFSSHFNMITYRHLISTLVDQQMAEANFGRLVFCNTHCLATLFKAGQLQFASSIPVHTPDDLAYRCLLLMKNASIENSDLQWYYSGMLDEDSQLFKTLDHFVANLHRWNPVQTVEGTREPHYFSHLQNLSL